MTTPTDCSDPTAAISEPPPSDFEAGLRRIITYTGEKRYRRWIAYTAVFLVIYFTLAKLISWAIFLLFGLRLSSISIFSHSFAFGIALQALDFIPLAITVLIFLKLRKIYRTR